MKNPRALLRHPVIGNLLLLLMLFTLVLIANAPILSNDIMYPEQATLYLVNQSIHSLGDLFNVYLHPKGLDDVIPFFRPSGHFFMYQLLTPFIGWHNTRALIIVNMLFLSMTGFVMIRLYQLLFPRQRVGGYLAFALYLMHPSLILSRFLQMHFEFAHVFFLMAGLYYFVLFCQKNSADIFRHFSLLAISLICYAIAITFKESAIMLGPLMVTYFILHFNRQLASKQSREILLLLIVVTVTFGIYLTLPWPHLEHPLKHHATLMDKLAVLNQFFKDFLGTQYNVVTNSALPYLHGDAWRHAFFPPVYHELLIIFFFVGLLNAGWVFSRRQNTSDKKSLLFVILAALLFLAIPCQWAMALPWHWNVSILFFSLMMGFGVEVWLKKCISLIAIRQTIYTGLFILLIVMAYRINDVNIAKILQFDPAMILNREAVYHPPAIRDQLNSESIILVSAHPDQDVYLFGNASPSYLAVKEYDYDKNRKKLTWIYRHYDPYYNGALFKWAYLMPDLREEVYPFTITQLQAVPSEEIYRWLENTNNLFCFDTDAQLKWHDVTAQFKQNLLQERDRRHLVVSSYDVHYAEKLSGNVINRVSLPYPDSQLCKYACAQNSACKGFTYEAREDSDHSVKGCEFYDDISTRDAGEFCASCQGFIKKGIF